MSFAMMLTLIVLALFGQADPTTAPATARVQFRLVAVADDPAAEVVRVADPEGDETELRLSRDVVLDGSHVASAKVRRGLEPGTWIVSVEFTEPGSRRLADVTGANIDRRLAVVVDGAVLMAPMIRTRISGSAEITGGRAGFDRARAEQVAGAISAASGGPSTRPAR